jgi:hypothetical protein
MINRTTSIARAVPTLPTNQCCIVQLCFQSTTGSRSANSCEGCRQCSQDRSTAPQTLFVCYRSVVLLVNNRTHLAYSCEGCRSAFKTEYSASYRIRRVMWGRSGPVHQLSHPARSRPERVVRPGGGGSENPRGASSTAPSTQNVSPVHPVHPSRPVVRFDGSHVL